MKMRQERTGSVGTKVPPETVPKPARRPSAESRHKPDTESKVTRNEDLPPVTRPRVPTGESEQVSEEGLVRPSSIKRPRASSQTPPKPQAKPRDKKEDKEQEEKKEEKKKEEKKKEEKPIEMKKEEPTPVGVLKLGEEIGESVDGGLHEDETTKEKKEKLKLKVKPDEQDADLWVKRDMPSPKRSPKSPHKPPPAPINTETEHIKSDSKPMSPITRAATLPKPWSPSATTTRSLPRKYSFEYKPSGSEEAKEEFKTTRKDSINEEKEDSVEKTVKEKSGEESPQKSMSPFRLPSRKTSTKESKEDTPPHKDTPIHVEDKQVDQTTTETTADHHDKPVATTPEKDEEKPKSQAEDVNPLEDETWLLSTDSSSSSDSPKKNERPISTGSDNTVL